MRNAKPVLFNAILVLGLTGCTTGANDYPSLAKRPAERISGTAEPVPSAGEVPTDIDGDLPEKLERLIARAETAHGQFMAEHPRSRDRIAAARGAAVASDSWVGAQVALAGLDASRSEAAITLAELDQLYADERIANWQAGITPDAEAIGVARDRVQSLVSEEDRLLAALDF